MEEPLAYPGLVRAIAWIVLAPSRLFAALREQPRALGVSVLVVAAVTIVMLGLLKPPFGDGQSPLLSEIRREIRGAEMTAEQKGVIEDRLEGWLGYLVAAIGPLATAVQILLVAVILRILLGLTRSVSPGPPVAFRQLLSLAAHASLIDVIGLLFKTPLFIAKGSMRVYTSLALLLPEDAAREPWFQLLAAFDAFTIWKLVLLTLGLVVIAQRGRRTAALLVFVPWITSVLLFIGVGAFFASVGGR